MYFISRIHNNARALLLRNLQQCCSSVFFFAAVESRNNVESTLELRRLSYFSLVDFFIVEDSATIFACRKNLTYKFFAPGFHYCLKWGFGCSSYDILKSSLDPLIRLIKVQFGLAITFLFLRYLNGLRIKDKNQDSNSFCNIDK